MTESASLFKAEAYELFRRKSLYVCLGLVAFFAVFTSLIFSLFGGLIKESYYTVKNDPRLLRIAEQAMLGDGEDAYQSGMELGLSGNVLTDSFMVGIYTSVETMREQDGDAASENIDDYFTRNTIKPVSKFADSGIVQITTLILSILFASSLYHNGIIKNTAIKGFSKRKIYLVQFALTAVYAVVSSLVFLALFSLVAFPLSKAEIEFSPLSPAEFAVKLFLICAFAGVFVLIGNIFRNGGLSMGVSIAVLLIGNMLISFAGELFKLDYLSDLTPSAAISRISGTESANDLAFGLFVALVYLTITAVAGTIISSRRDING